MKIKLKTKILLGGKVASPDDGNKGIYEVHKNLANSLIARKRAVLYSEIEKKGDGNKDGINIQISLEEAKQVADELGISYAKNIGVVKLLERIVQELEIQAAKYGFKIEKISVEEAMKLYRAKKAEEEKGDGKNDKEEDPEKLQKLKELAEEAEIEFNENIKCGELEKLLEVELEKYASEEKIEIPNDSDVFTAWHLIKEKIKGAD